jgi:hypothetical protein
MEIKLEKIKLQEGDQEGLQKLFDLCEWHLKDPGALSQIGAYHDVRPFMDLLEYASKGFTKDIKFLTPPIQKRFIEIAKVLFEISKEYEKNYKIYKDYKEVRE